MSGPFHDPTQSCSLLVPCRNAYRFLPRLWASVRAQTRPFDDIICYDDCSSDGTATLARALGATVISGATPRGAAGARNRLWKAARTEWVHFHDADDLMDADFLQTMAAAATDEVDAVICNATWRFESGGIQREWRYSDAELRRDPASYLVKHPVGGINGLYRRSLLERVGGFSEELPVWEDADLHVRIALAGGRFRVVERPLVTALRRDDSLSADQRRNWNCRLSALESYVPKSHSPSFSRAIGDAAEEAASELATIGEMPAARRALDLCRSLGLNPPTTRHPLLAALRPFLPAVTLLRLQRRWRRHSAG